jgi:amino acid permease
MKSREGNHFWLATVTLIGTIIGVGIFGVPYAISQVGVVLALVYLVILGGIQLLQSLFMAEAAMAHKGKIRIIGLAGRYIGPRARHVAAIATVLGFWGGLIAYIVVGGTFLHFIFSPIFGGTPILYQIGWGLAGGAVVYFGMHLVEKVNFISSVALGITMLLLIALAVRFVDIGNLPAFASGDLFLPYGVILFALGGVSAVSEMEDMMEGRHRGFRKAIVVGSLIATVLTALFAFAIYGATGASTTQDAVFGLKAVMGNGITLFAAAFGFLAVATSYFIIALGLKSSFEYDYKMHRLPAWAMSCLVPLALVLIGVSNFISIIGFTGAVFGGITAVIVAWLYIEVTKKKLLGNRALGIPLYWAYISIVVLLLGAAYEVISSVRGLI